MNRLADDENDHKCNHFYIENTILHSRKFEDRQVKDG